MCPIFNLCRVSYHGAMDTIEIINSKDYYITDAEGKKYLDFTGGWSVGHLGWSNKHITSAVKKFNGPTYVYPEFEYEPWNELRRVLSEITPGDLQYSHRATGGTEAVDIALQLAKAYTGKNNFVAIKDSYHGNSMATKSVADSGQIQPPLNGDAARKIEEILSNGDVAAVIMEPIILNLGVEIPTQEFFDLVTGACKKHGALLISDEVATGFGRTGKMFASEHFNLKPDILCLAKALSGGYAAIGATVVTNEVAEKTQDMSFYSTFGWHPMSVAAALANLKYLMENREQVLNNANDLGRFFQDKLSAIKFQSAVEVKLKGAAIGLHFKEDNYGEEMRSKAQDLGLLVSDISPNVIVLFPALNTPLSVANKAIKILAHAAKA